MRETLILSPIQVGPVELRNRVISTSHGTQYGPWSGGSPDRYIEYQRRRVASGLGMIVTEGLYVDRVDPEEIDRLAAPFGGFAAAMRSEGTGTALVLQLNGWGGEASSDPSRPRRPLVSFNGRQSPISGEPSHRLSAGEIEELVARFARAAQVATESGLDGVELQGSHGWLIHQSLSAWGNEREDEWGRPLAFARALIEAVGAAIGPEKILGFRVSVDDYRPPHEGGERAEELAGVAREIVATGRVDYLNLGMGSRLRDYVVRTARSFRHPPGADLPRAARVRGAIEARVPVVGVNHVLTPAEGEEALQRGDCDLVALTRAHIADPEALAKFRAGRGDRIRRCVGVNECGSTALTGVPMLCFHNPEVGREGTALAPAGAPKRVVVVGAGPGGLKAAEVAARRGHEVVVVDAAEQPGGALRHVRGGPTEELFHAVSWLVEELDELGVERRMGVRLDGAALRELAPEAVILASGATRATGAAIPDGEGVRVLTGSEALAGAVGERVLVFDQLGDVEAATVTEALVARGLAVTYVTPFDGFAPRAGALQLRELAPILRDAGCEVLTGTDLRVDPGHGLRLVDDRGADSAGPRVDTVVALSAPEPNLSLRPALEEMVIPFHLVGDALAPRGASAAIRDGDDAARAL